jgi:histidyl-tRNA synthetase
MVADSEALKVLSEILDALPGIGAYAIRLNHRKLLDGMMQLCGVPEDKLRPICSAIDKLDKEQWHCGASNEAAAEAKCTCVKHEMTRTKGLDEAAADKLGELVKIKGEPLSVLAQLRGLPGFEVAAAGTVESQAAQGLRELEVLFKYLGALGCLPRISFDLSLARGLDYYTGVIYEAAQTGPSAVGSIAAGGRYDGLVGMFSGREVPAVGVSIGIERILTIMEEAERKKGKVRAKTTQVYVAINPAPGGSDAGVDSLPARMAVASRLWSAGVAAEYCFDAAPTWSRQAKDAAADAIPYVLILGAIGSSNDSKDLAPNEGYARIMDRARKAAPGAHSLGELVRVEDAPAAIKQRLAAAAEAAAAAVAPAPAAAAVAVPVA